MNKKNRWNNLGWPWELELITLIFFLLALFVPLFFQTQHDASTIRQFTPSEALESGRQSLSTQFGFLLTVLVAALYVIHIAFGLSDINRVTASPTHLFSPVAFAVIAYYRILEAPELQNTALSFINGSTFQVAGLVIGMSALTTLLTWIRRHRFMMEFDDIHWDVISPAAYDASYFGLTIQLRPMLYAPRRYLACQQGFIIEGWFYVMPIEFEDINGLCKVKNSGLNNTGLFFASSSRHLIRIDLHDSIKDLYISPRDDDDFISYCTPFVAKRKRPSRKAGTTHHGLRGTDSHAGDQHHTTR